MPTKQIHLEVQAKQYRFVLKLLEALPFVRVQQENQAFETNEALTHVTQGFKELTLMREGKLNSRPIEALFDELPD